jgi:hypothetical protein
VRIRIEEEEVSLVIHVDQRLTRETIRWWDSPDSDDDILSDEPKPPYVDEIFSIPGVEEIGIQQHDITVKRGELFSWGNMLGKILIILWNHLDEKGDLVFVSNDRETPVTRQQLMRAHLKLPKLRAG